MTEPTAVADRLRRAESRLSQLEDLVEVIDHRRTTWVPWRSWENLSGRQREVAYFLIVWVALLVARKVRSNVSVARSA